MVVDETCFLGIDESGVPREGLLGCVDMAARGVVTGFVVGLMLVAGCSGHSGGDPAKPTRLADPCALLTDELLAKLSPGSSRVPSETLGEISGTKRCEVNLEEGSSGMRGDLAVSVAVDGTDSYDDGWRNNRCGRIQADPSDAGPGDVSCLKVKPWDGVESRIDGWAWIGDDYEAYVAYQLVAPRELPVGAETDMRALLAAAVDSLPV